MTNTTSETKRVKVAEHAELEALVINLSKGLFNEDEMWEKAKAMAKRAGLDMDLEYGDYYSQALLFEARDLISKQDNINENKIDVCVFPIGNGGHLQIGTETIKNVEELTYYRSGCGL